MSSTDPLITCELPHRLHLHTVPRWLQPPLPLRVYEPSYLTPEARQRYLARTRQRAQLATEAAWLQDTAMARGLEATGGTSTEDVLRLRPLASPMPIP